MAERKLKETADRLKQESLDDPFSGTMASASATLGNDDVRTNTVGAEDEKTSLFKKQARMVFHYFQVPLDCLVFMTKTLVLNVCV